MRNEFNIDVCFDEIPSNPVNWIDSVFISKLPVIRVTSKIITDFLTYDCTLNTEKNTLLLSDTKTCLVLRLKSGKIIKRSYLLYDKDLEVCEYACNLKTTAIKYEINSKLEYVDNSEDKKICDYVLKSIKSIKDDYKIRYLYYLYFEDIGEYSKEKLINDIDNNPNGNIEKLYNFLHVS